MKISIKNFYEKSFTHPNLTHLWYEDGSFSVQRKDGKVFQISRQSASKELRDGSAKTIEKADQVGYFTVIGSSQSFGQYSIAYTCRLRGGGNSNSSCETTCEAPSNQSDQSKASMEIGHGGSSSSKIPEASVHTVCEHNDRSGISLSDIVSHALKLEFPEAYRDGADAFSGYEPFTGFNNPPPDKSSNDSPPSNLNNAADPSESSSDKNPKSEQLENVVV